MNLKGWKPGKRVKKERDELAPYVKELREVGEEKDGVKFPSAPFEVWNGAFGMVSRVLALCYLL